MAGGAKIPSVRMAPAEHVQLVRAPLGYLEVTPKPSPDELRDYYRDRYYADEQRATLYSRPYTPEEVVSEVSVRRSPSGSVARISTLVKR